MSRTDGRVVFARQASVLYLVPCSGVAVIFGLLVLTFVLSHHCLVFFFNLSVPCDRPMDPVLVLGSCSLLLTESGVLRLI